MDSILILTTKKGKKMQHIICARKFNTISQKNNREFGTRTINVTIQIARQKIFT